MSGFRLDTYLVTVGRFRQFVNAVQPADSGTRWLPVAGSGVHTHLNGGLGLVSAGVTSADAGVAYEPGWVASDDSNIVPTDANLACDVYATWTPSPGSNENLPINCVNWFEAYAFCIWDGGFLPSDAELEYAAAGGSQQREYPWGSTDPGTSNEYAIYGDTPSLSPNPNGELCYYPGGNLVACTGVTNIAPVGTARLGAGLWGQLDLAGELSAWDLDKWILKPVDPCMDCTLVSGAGGRATRGGACDSPKAYLLPSSRGAGTPIVRTDAFGVRCARTP